MPEAIDRRELDLQTFGDKALAREILEMFRAEAPELLRGLAAAAGQARAEIAHRIKGSARAIGAGRLAEAAELLERVAEDAARLEAVERETRAVLDEIGDLLSG